MSKYRIQGVQQQKLPKQNIMGTVCCENEKQQKSQINNHKKICNILPHPSQKSNPHQDIPGLKFNQISTSSNNQQISIAKHGPENYQSVKYLGRGTFGDVVLTEDKENKNQYAMKIIQKRKIKQFNVLQNQKIKKISQNILFASIRQTFQNDSKIYIVMQYMPKGDIYYYLRRKQCIFTQQIIKMLVSQIIVGIEILHQHGIIYRQLKPQNILVTNDGHIKLTDYGLSKMIIQEHNAMSTFIGTLQYTAPEALKGHYGKEVDIWAIGVLMFQLKFARNLFESNQYDTNQQIQTNIQKTNIEEILNGLIGMVTHDFRDVLIKLLNKDPQKRISLQDLKKHQFFIGIHWSDIPLRKNPPPLQVFLSTDHIKFRDPTNQNQLSHRKLIENKKKVSEFKASLYQFRSSD